VNFRSGKERPWAVKTVKKCSGQFFYYSVCRYESSKFGLRRLYKSGTLYNMYRKEANMVF
jgi:hypothetical protein